MINKAKWVGYSLQLVVISSTINDTSIVLANKWKSEVHRKLIDINHVLSLAEDRHYERIHEYNTFSSPLVPVTLNPVGNIPIGDLPDCPQNSDGSFGDTTTPESIQIPYGYELQYKNDFNGLDDVDVVINAVENLLSDYMYLSIFPDCESDVDNSTRRTTVQGKSGLSSKDMLRQKLSNFSNRRLMEMMGMTSAPNDFATDENCSNAIAEDAECKVVEGALTVFFSNESANDGGSMTSNVVALIQNIFDSGILMSAHPSVLSMSYVSNDSLFSINDDEDDISSFGINDDEDDNFTRDPIGPDEDETSGNTAVIISSVVGTFVVLAVGSVYYKIKSKDADQGSENSDSIGLYDEAVL